jgi:hypothetical protein
MGAAVPKDVATPLQDDVVRILRGLHDSIPAFSGDVHDVLTHVDVDAPLAYDPADQEEAAGSIRLQRQLLREDKATSKELVHQRMVNREIVP